MESKFVNTNNIQLHYLESKHTGKTLILMPGLTANAHAFDGLMKAGLENEYHILSIDLRGRGLSDYPANGYSMKDHAEDIIGLLDALNIQSAIIGGHSFGALLTLYLAYYYPLRVEKMILLDAAAKMHPNTREMLQPSLNRLGQTFPSFNDYILHVKRAPYMDFWDEEMLSYYDADVLHHTDGTVTARSSLANIIEAVTAVLAEPWIDYLRFIDKEAILINGAGNYAMNAPLLPVQNALETVSMMKNCMYSKVNGNHQTMLYGNGAKEIVQAIKEFM
jgi:pimeloyl-ACP methyl ester carboxylesterase